MKGCEFDTRLLSDQLDNPKKPQTQNRENPRSYSKFLKITPGANVIRLFCTYFTDFRNKARVFVPCKPLQLMFAGKAHTARYGTTRV